MNRLLKSIIPLCLIVLSLIGCETIDAAKEEPYNYEAETIAYKTLDVDDLRAPESTESYYEEATEGHYEIAVYVSRAGKIHRYSNCSGMKYYTEMSQDAAVNRGYDYCKKCY